MSFLPALGHDSPLHAQMHMMYYDAVPSQTAWYGQRNRICVAWYIESGSVTLSFHGRTLHVQAGQWVFQSPGLELDQVFDPCTRLISLRFQLRWHNGHTVFSDGTALSLDASDYPQLKKSALALIRHCKSIDHDLSEILHCQNLFTCWLQHCYSAMCDIGFVANPCTPKDVRMSQAFVILQHSLQMNDVPYDELCTATQLSQVHLNRLFVRHFGHSPKRQHDILRIEHAHKLLAESRMAMKTIAATLGFADSSQFTKWFHRIDGHTPSQARKLLAYVL